MRLKGKSFIFKVENENEVTKLNNIKGNFETVNRNDYLPSFGYTDMIITEDCNMIPESFS